MKRCDFKAHFDPYYGCDVAEPEDCSDGDWVPASVAQALYDAAARVASHQGDDITVAELREMISQCKEALSLADGEE